MPVLQNESQNIQTKKKENKIEVDKHNHLYFMFHIMIKYVKKSQLRKHLFNRVLFISLF